MSSTQTPELPTPTQSFSTALVDAIFPAPDQRPKLRPEPHRTPLGVLCARSWDDAWIAKVVATELRLNRPVCGARTPSGNPCELEPNHENGRCRFHGGFDLTGAAPGNRNAVIHGLYSRRLRTCTHHCPMWRECPCAGPDLRQVPETDRPTCPYEQTEYNTVLTDALTRSSITLGQDPMGLHLAHNVALLQVMLTRAAAGMRDDPMIDTLTTVRTTETRGENPTNSTNETFYQRPSARLQAFLRVSAEQRKYLALLDADKSLRLSVGDHLNRTLRTHADASLDPDHAQLMHPDACVLLNETQRHIVQAITNALQGDDLDAEAAFNVACQLATPPKYGQENPINALRFDYSNVLAETTTRTLRQHLDPTRLQKVHDKLQAEAAKKKPNQT